jgi:altronate hydrolase
MGLDGPAGAFVTTPTPAGIVEPLVPMAGVDDVGLVVSDVPRGTPIPTAVGLVTAIDDIPQGHKVAVRAVAVGAPVHKYGEVIGIARQDIAPAAHVHSHNLGVGQHTASAAPFRSPPSAWSPPAEPTRDHFYGYRRSDGRAATRNYIAVLPTVNCSATVARMVAQTATSTHAGVPGLDGVIALSHDLGCGMAEGTAGDSILRRTLRGYAGHANIAALLTISLGCEVNQPENIFGASIPAETLGIQELGGTAATVNAALGRIAEMVPQVATLRRNPPGLRLVLGLQCGGSDAYWPNRQPDTGVAADLVAAGGRVILGETPRSTGRSTCATGPRHRVGQRIDELIAWWPGNTADAELTATRHGQQGRWHHDDLGEVPGRRPQGGTSPSTTSSGTPSRSPPPG